MSSDDRSIEILKLIINDEHQYRSMVQSRISFHTSIILALIALIGAFSLRADNGMHYIIVAFAGLLVVLISNQAVESVKRLYDHFIDTIRAREEIENVLGIRDLENKRKDQRKISSNIRISEEHEKLSTNYWPFKELYSGSWVPSNEEKGYFSKTEELFASFKRIGWGIFCFFVLVAIGRWIGICLV